MKIPRIFKRRWFQLAFLLIIIFGSYFAWQQANKKPEEIKTYTVTKQNLKQVITASGKISAKDHATLRFLTPSRLAWVGVREGDTVAQWQAIASQDENELQKNLKKALNVYRSTRADFEQTLDNNDDFNDIAYRNYLEIATTDDTNNVLLRTLLQSQLSLDNSVLDVELLDLSRQYAHLYSPINGIVIQATDEHPGVITSATTQYVIVDPNTLRFSADIEESDIGFIKEGQSATINLDAFPDDYLETKVENISFTSTTTTSGGTAYLTYFPIQLKPGLRLDMNGDVEITIQTKEDVISIPIEAVTENEEGKQVTIQKGEETEQKTIQVGIETDNEYEVIEGLNQGDILVLPK